MTGRLELSAGPADGKSMLFRAAATALLLTLLGAAPALAGSKDRDRDGLPDRWERKYHVSKPKADNDRDGLTNRVEYKLKTNPRRRDTDRDGLRDRDEMRFRWDPRKRDTDGDSIRDGRENAGVVTAVAGTRVTIRLASGGKLIGLVEDPTALSCTAPGAGPAAPSESSAALPGTPPEDPEWDPAWGPKPLDLDGDDDGADVMAEAAQAEDDEVEEPGGDDFAAEEAAEDAAAMPSPTCQARLRVGARVHEAESDLGRNGRRLSYLRLVG
jgi:hypothetical protein